MGKKFNVAVQSLPSVQRKPVKGTVSWYKPSISKIRGRKAQTWSRLPANY